MMVKHVFHVAVGLNVATALAGCLDFESPEKKRVRAAEAEERRERAECQTRYSQLLEDAERFLKAKNAEAAENSVRRCADLTGDQRLNEIRVEARIVSTTNVLERTPPADWRERLRLIRNLAEVESTAAAKYTAELRRLEAREQFENKKAEAEARRAEVEAKKAEIAARRRQGVRIGMSKEDVLASQWGRPERINTTTTGSGDSEQWVYGGGNYLYFRGNVLTSIQTRK